VNLKTFFDSIRGLGELFPNGLTQTQVERMQAIIDGLQARKVSIRHAAYILATAHHESGRFNYMQEIWGPTPVQKRYQGRKTLGNVVAGDGKKFLGRGFVQITGRTNYTDWSRRLGVDLIKEPDLASQVKYAVPILIDGMLQGTFTTKKLSDFSTYLDMRRVVNKMDRASLIAGYAVDYEDALRKANYGVVVAEPKPPIEDAKPKPPKPVIPARRSMWSVLIEAILKLFTRSK
jgi:predicted chitinase